MAQNYFIGDGNIGLNTEKLVKEGITFCKLDVDGEEGIVIERDLVEKTLKILDAEIEHENRTGLEGVSRIIIRYRGTTAPSDSKTSSYRIIINDHASIATDARTAGRETMVKQLAEILRDTLIPVLKRDIVLNVPHAHPRSPGLDTRGFNINVWSTPNDGTRTSRRTPPEMWGIRVDMSGDNSYGPSVGGLPIYSEEGCPVAELYGSNDLYIFHDALHRGTSYELQIFRKIMEEASKVAGLTKEELKAYKDAELERLITVSKEMFVKACSSTLNYNVAEAKRDVRQATDEISQTNQRIIQLIRNRDVYRARADSLEEKARSTAALYEIEYTKTVELSMVKYIVVEHKNICVYTKMINCQNPKNGKMYELGEYRIEFSLDGSDTIVRMYNVTRAVDAYERGMQAPHVFSDGRPCLGNMDEVLPELIGAYEISAATTVTIDFLSTVNDSDGAGRFVVKWPLVIGDGSLGEDTSGIAKLGDDDAPIDRHVDND